MSLFYDITDLSINELVVVEIKNITNFGINVVLLEYNNTEALINLREISTNKYRSLNGLINVGDIEVVQVTNIDIKNENSIFIDLTRKYIDENKKEVIYKKYLLLKKLNNMIKFSKFDENVKINYIKYIKENKMIKKLLNNDIMNSQDIHNYLMNKLFPKEQKKHYNKKLVNKTNKFTLVKDIKNYLTFLELYYPIKVIVDDIKLGNIIIKTKIPLFKNEFDDLIKNIDNEDFNYNFEWYLKSKPKCWNYRSRCSRKDIINRSTYRC